MRFRSAAVMAAIALLLMMVWPAAAQFGNNAKKIQGMPVCAGVTPADGNPLTWDATAGCWGLASKVAISTTVLPGTAIATTSATTVDLIAGNNGQQIAFTSGTAVTLNISSAVAVQGFSILIIQRGAGTVTPTAGAGVTIRQRQSYTKTAGQYAVATLSCDIAGDCILAGDLQ